MISNGLRIERISNFRIQTKREVPVLRCHTQLETRQQKSL